MKTTPILLALTLLAAGCGDPVHPDHNPASGIRSQFVTANGVATSITRDQFEAAAHIGIGWVNGGTHVGKAFDANPHLGDAIVATFVWPGTSNTITQVTDHLEDGTPVGNSYTLVDYATANGWSVATYVATDVRNFPDPAPSPDKILAVHAIFSDVFTNGSELIAAYRGVSPVTLAALGAHRAAAGTGSTTTIADPGSIAVDAGAGIYALTAANAVVDLTPPAGLSIITGGWDADSTIKLMGNDGVATAAATIEPQWTWSFKAPSTWLATVLALNPQLATHLGFAVQPSYTLLPGLAISPPVQVAVLDNQGHTATGFEGSVTVALANDGSLLHNAHLLGTTVATVVNGIATFADLRIDEPGTGYTLSAATDNLTGATSDPFGVTLH